MNVQRAIDALARINKRLSIGEEHLPAYELKLLRKAHAKWKKELDAFTNPKAPARPLPVKTHPDLSGASQLNGNQQTTLPL